MYVMRTEHPCVSVGLIVDAYAQSCSVRFEKNYGFRELQWGEERSLSLLRQLYRQRKFLPDSMYRSSTVIAATISPRGYCR